MFDLVSTPREQAQLSVREDIEPARKGCLNVTREGWVAGGISQPMTFGMVVGMLPGHGGDLHGLHEDGALGYGDCPFCQNQTACVRRVPCVGESPVDGHRLHDGVVGSASVHDGREDAPRGTYHDDHDNGYYHVRLGDKRRTQRW